jgi:HEAT repeat protein
VALSDDDPVVRGLASLAIRNAGRASCAALQALIPRLADEDPNVRLMSAQAIGSCADGAVSAVPALMQACGVTGEQVHVLRSLADALGSIGPKASSALPVLRQLSALPRVRWAADAAVRKISVLR